MNSDSSQSAPSHSAFIGLGSNLGDREENIQTAAAKLAATQGVTSIFLSDLLENPAVGGPPDSPPFLNAVVEITTRLGPPALLARLLQIEADMGRVRRRRNEPRLIDLDLLLYGTEILNTPGLILPHPRLHERRFVLQPLAQIAPDLLHPTLGKTIHALLDELPPIP